MTITFEDDKDIIIYALEKIISFARENQSLFVANCAWWIASIIGLDPGLRIYIDNLETRKPVRQHREISSTPRDIAREVSPPDTSASYIPDPLRRTGKGRITPLPISKRQLKKSSTSKKSKQEYEVVTSVDTG